MPDANTFRTIASKSLGEYKEKGSKFIALAYPVNNEAEIKAILEEEKKEHHKARHICYAYILGADKAISKAHDAGEPTHSAGAPILGQIRSLDLTNTLIVVVRYFGGTKLGLGGLVSAYKAAAEDALQYAEIVEDYEKVTLSISVVYEDMPRLMDFLKKHKLAIREQIFKDDCLFSIEIALSEKENIIKLLNSNNFSILAV